MNRPSRVSVIVPFYNCRFVDRAINSALDQTHPDVEIVVVNDGSTRELDRLEPFRGRVRVVDKSNGGTASALNAGTRAATGDYWTWLSSDDLYHPEKVAAQLALMHESRASVSYGSWVNIDADDNEHELQRHAHPRRTDFARALIRSNFINGCTVMMRREVLDRVGRFDEGLKYTQDYDYWIRVAYFHNFAYLDRPLVRYRIHPQQTTQQRYEAVLAEQSAVQARHSLLDVLARELHRTEREVQELAEELERYRPARARLAADEQVEREPQ